MCIYVKVRVLKKGKTHTMVHEQTPYFDVLVFFKRQNSTQRLKNVHIYTHTNTPYQKKCLVGNLSFSPVNLCATLAIAFTKKPRKSKHKDDEQENKKMKN